MFPLIMYSLYIDVELGQFIRLCFQISKNFILIKVTIIFYQLLQLVSRTSFDLNLLLFQELVFLFFNDLYLLYGPIYLLTILFSAIIFSRKPVSLTT